MKEINRKTKLYVGDNLKMDYRERIGTGGGLL
jgi:hypothetical protein